MSKLKRKDYEELLEPLQEELATMARWAQHAGKRVLVLFEGAWMDPDKDGIDRAGNPDFLTLDNPSPAGAFAYNNAMVQIKKSSLVHRPGWDELAVARSAVFRRDM